MPTWRVNRTEAHRPLAIIFCDPPITISPMEVNAWIARSTLAKRVPTHLLLNWDDRSISDVNLTMSIASGWCLLFRFLNVVFSSSVKIASNSETACASWTSGVNFPILVNDVAISENPNTSRG